MQPSSEPRYPTPDPDAVINIAVAIILSIVTCGLYSLYWQYRQIEALNAFFGRHEYDFWMWILLTVVTCGLFALYYEYKMADGLNEINESYGRRVDTNLPLICLLLSVFGLWLVSLAIQQNEINALHDVSADY